MDWQSPASHPLHMAQALSELIKRHFFTSPDAREKEEEKRERRKEPEGGILLSLYSGLLVNEDISQYPLLFLFLFLPLQKKKKGKKKRKTALPIAFGQIVLAISKTIILR